MTCVLQRFASAVPLPAGRAEEERALTACCTL
jgi:hypothetical protein